MPEEVQEEKKVEEKPQLEVEDKYKHIFNQIDKRFVNLELAIGQFNEKIKKVEQLDILSEIKEKVEELEDFSLVDTLGLTELKDVISNLEKKYEELATRQPVVSMTPEDLGRIAASLVPPIESAVMPKIQEKVEQRLKSIATESGIRLAPEDLDKTLAKIREEIDFLKNKIKPLETEIIQKIVSEISDLRTETSKEVMGIKDRIEGVSATKSDIDIKFLSSRVNALKENVDYLLNRKTEIDLKIENLKKTIKNVAEESVPADIVETTTSNRRVLTDLSERISAIERSLKTLETIKTTDSGKLYARIVDMYDKMNQKLEETKKLTSGQTFKPRPEHVDEDIDKLLNKITYLESRLAAIEKILSKDTSGPVIIE